MSIPARPEGLFDREWEWQALGRFATDERAGATLGVVSGRRRQGKSFLLQTLCEATGGLYHEAFEATAAESLRRFGARLGEHAGAPGRLDLASWEEAVAAVLRLGEERPLTVVLDEFPYLVQAAPELPSVVQAAYGPRSSGRTASRTRLVLCGSAPTVMGRLLSGDAPLRGRAGLELLISAFDHRQAAAFWGLGHDPGLAFKVYAVVGGTPAYRREFVADDTPVDAADFDAWVVRSVLNPALPLFREGRYLLAEESELRDRALYHSLLAALVEGRTTRGAAANRLGRSSNDLGHPLAVLEDAGFVLRDDDAFRRGRPTFRVADPYLRFHHAVIRPRWEQLARPGRTAAVWADAAGTFAARVLGPQFEQVCRDWTSSYAAPGTTGGPVRAVRRGTVADRRGRATHDVDVVALGGEGAERVLLLGEAKYGEVMHVGHLDRLRTIRDLLAARDDVDVTDARLACFSGAGFSPELRGAAARGEVTLVDVERLYDGD